MDCVFVWDKGAGRDLSKRLTNIFHVFASAAHGGWIPVSASMSPFQPALLQLSRHASEAHDRRDYQDRDRSARCELCQQRDPGPRRAGQRAGWKGLLEDSLTATDSLRLHARLGIGQHRAVATRYDKREFTYQGIVDVASTRIWLPDPVP